MSSPFVEIGDFCTTGSGGTPLRKVPEYYGGNIPWVKSGDLRESEVTNASEYLTELGLRKSSAKTVPKGSILLAMYGATVGRMAILGIDAATNQAVCHIVPDPLRVFPRYLYYALSSKVPEFLRNAVGGAQPNISQGIIKRTKVPLPSVPEQKHIAIILDKADSLRRKRKQAVELADQFLRSVFLDMFGEPVANTQNWVEFPLEEGIRLIESGWSAKGSNLAASQGQVGVLKISSVTSGTFRATENKAVEQGTIPKEKKLVLPRAGDLLFSRANTRELVAATALVDKDYDDLFLPDKLWRIHTNEKLLPEFLHYLIQQHRMRDRLTSQATGTSGSMLNISKKKLLETRAIFPPLPLQLRFADIYSRTRNLTFNQRAANVEANDLFNSLSQRAFSGQL